MTSKARAAPFRTVPPRCTPLRSHPRSVTKHRCGFPPAAASSDSSRERSAAPSPGRRCRWHGGSRCGGAGLLPARPAAQLPPASRPPKGSRALVTSRALTSDRYAFGNRLRPHTSTTTLKGSSLHFCSLFSTLKGKNGMNPPHPTPCPFHRALPGSKESVEAPEES